MNDGVITYDYKGIIQVLTKPQVLEKYLSPISLKGDNSMEENPPNEKDVGGSITPFPTQINMILYFLYEDEIQVNLLQ